MDASELVPVAAGGPAAGRTRYRVATEGYEHFWSNVLDSSMRAKVRRAERLGVEVTKEPGTRGVGSLVHFKRRFGAVEHRKLELSIESPAAARAGDARDALRAWVQPLRRRFG